MGVGFGLAFLGNVRTGRLGGAALADVRNYHRIVDAARDVLGESGADASMEEIAARAGVDVGTVYRRFASKDALSQR